MSKTTSTDKKSSLKGSKKASLSSPPYGETLMSSLSPVRLTNTKGLRMWPTPTARDHKDSGDNLNLYRHDRQSAQLGIVAKRTDPTGGSLNPMWVEWLMGWPLEWTGLKPLETDKFHLWLQQHGNY